MQIVSMATFFFSGCQSAGVDYVHLQNHKEDNAGNIQGKATSQTVTMERESFCIYSIYVHSVHCQAKRGVAGGNGPD